MQGSASVLLAARAISHARESFVITDADLTAPGPRIVYVNPAFTTLTGYEPHEVYGLSPRILQGPRTDPAVLDRLRDQLRRGEPFEGEAINYRKGGQEFLMDWYIVPLRQGTGPITHFLGVQRDATQQRRLESIAAAVNLADQLGYVVAGLRHELGNPVNSLKAALTMLHANATTYSPERQLDLLGRCLEEVNRMEYLLRALRSFTAFERLHPQPLDLVAFVRRFVPLIHEDLLPHGISFQLTCPDHAPAALADSRALHQVLLNLVSNAIDALTEVTDRRLEIRLEVRPPLLVLGVGDSGRGMSPEQLARTEQPFHSTKAGGNGLGLAICRQMLAKMGATLRLESAVGQGTWAWVEMIGLPEDTERNPR